MKCQSVILCSLVGVLTLAACGDKPVTKTNSRQENEDCTETIGCIEGLFCEDGKCRRLCQGDKDCGTGYYCLNSRCVSGGSNVNPGTGDNTDHPGTGDNTDHPGPGDNTDQPLVTKEEAEMPAGGVFTPMSATVSNQRYKARIIGGALQQHVSNDTNSAIVHDGTWNAK